MDADNGSHVTWREFNLAMKPLFKAVERIEKAVDHLEIVVDELVNERAERAGAAQERSRWIESRRFLVALSITAVCGLLASVATLVWLAVG